MSEFNENDIIWFCRVNCNYLDRLNVDILRGRVRKTDKCDIKLKGRIVELYYTGETFLVGENWIHKTKQEAIDAMIARLEELKNDN